MEIGEWKPVGAASLLYRELGLETKVAELEAFGYTVVESDKVGPPEFAGEVKAALERTMLRRYGPDPDCWANVNDIQRFMLWEDPIFERLS